MTQREELSDESISDDDLAYNFGLEVRYAIAASGADPAQHIPEVDAIIKRRIGEIRSALVASPKREEESLWDNDAVWAAFYRDGKDLGEISKMFNCGVYDLSPWLTSPLVRAALSAKEGK